MSNNGAGAALVGVVLSGAAIVGLVLWGRSRAKAEREDMAKDDPTVDRIGMFPGLRVGDVVIVDSQAAKLPPPFSLLARQPAEVDMVLSDPLLVSVKCPPRGVRGIPGVPFFSGTIPRSAIVQVAPPVSLEV